MRTSDGTHGRRTALFGAATAILLAGGVWQGRTAVTVPSYFADFQTTGAEPQLFTPGSDGLEPAPLGSEVWFVADVLGDGIGGTAVGEITSISSSFLSSIRSSMDLDFPDTIGEGGAGTKPGDDWSILIDNVPGGAIAHESNAGRFIRMGIGVADQNDWIANASTHVFVLHDANGDEVMGNAGDTIGIGAVSVTPPGGPENWIYEVAMNVDGGAIAVVPEPVATTIVLGAVALAGGGLRRRRWAVRR